MTHSFYTLVVHTYWHMPLVIIFSFLSSYEFMVNLIKKSKRERERERERKRERKREREIERERKKEEKKEGKRRKKRR